MNEKLEKLQHFFSWDARTKRKMNEYVPPQRNIPMNLESKTKYVDELFQFLSDTYEELMSESQSFLNDDNLLKKINVLKAKSKKDLMLCSVDMEKLRSFYQIYVTNMEKDFLDSVKEECIGYSFRYPTNSIQKAVSINELLHLLHMYVMNQNSTYEDLPELQTKENEFQYPIRSFGEKSELVQSVFEEFPLSLDVGWTDIVSINKNKVIMMIRDRGHALTIEIEKEEDKYHIDYFIPKICNVEMVNQLPGVNKIHDYSIGTTGSFEIDQIESLYTFISMVPMDTDMINTKL